MTQDSPEVINHFRRHTQTQEELLQLLDELGIQLQQETQTTWEKWSCVSLA